MAADAAIALPVSAAIPMKLDTATVVIIWMNLDIVRLPTSIAAARLAAMLRSDRRCIVNSA